MSLPTKQQTNETLRNDMWRACDIMRRDNNVGGVMQYTEHLAWLLFLKFLDEEEKKRLAEAAFADEPYTPVLLGTDLAWDAWASPEKLTKTDADALITYVRGRVLPGLATLTGSPLARTVARIFSEETVGDNPNPVRNVPVCASGYNLKDVLEIRNVIRWLATRPGTTNCPYPTGSRNSPKAARSGTKTSTRRAPPGRTGNAGWTASVSAPFRWRLKCASAWERHYNEDGPKPAGPYSAWVETLDDLKERGYDLSARNPNQDDRIILPHPSEITAQLLERTASCTTSWRICTRWSATGLMRRRKQAKIETATWPPKRSNHHVCHQNRRCDT